MIEKDDIVRSPQGLVGIVEDLILDPDGIEFAIFRCVGSQRRVACPTASLSPHKWLNAVSIHQENKARLDREALTEFSMPTAEELRNW